jgi:hypothetical protein
LLGEITNPAQHPDGVRDRINAENVHRAGFRPQQTENVFDQSRLAGAVFADQSKDAAARHIERDVVQRRFRTEPAR